MTRPAVFIGSSSEGLPFARAVRQQLDQDAEVTMWNEGFFTLGNTFIETLVNSLGTFDFAILVLTGDDLIHSRNDERLGPRDNVIFELGLFMGRLGRSRTIALVESNAAIKIPTDLSGVTTAAYSWPREDGSHQRAVGAACDNIRQVIQALGITDSKTAKVLSGITARQAEQEVELKNHGEQIRMLKFAVRGIVTEYELQKLKGLNSEAPFKCYYSDDLVDELKRLRALGLITNYDGIGLRDIKAQFKDTPNQFELKRFFRITKGGQEYLELREQANDEPSE